MSERYCYQLWQSALDKLQILLNENTRASQDKDQLARAYLRYLHVLKKLDEVHTYIRQPQHREAVASSLLCCAGLLTESWSALVSANKGIDVIDFTSYLLELQLTPDDLEVSVPAVLKSSDRFRQAKLKAALAAAEASSTVPATSSAPEEPPIIAIKYSNSGKFCSAASGFVKSSTLPLDEPVENSNNVPDEAATKIQSAWRGWRDCRKAADKKLQELGYLGMSGRSDDPSTELISSIDLEEGAAARRERRRREYEQARLEIEQLLQLQETPLMVLEERNRVNSWLEQKIKSEGQLWPEVPLEGELAAPQQDSNASSSERNLENQNPKKQLTKQMPARDAAVSSASLKGRKLAAVGGGISTSTPGATASSSSEVSTFASQLAALVKIWNTEAEKILASEDNGQNAWPNGTDTTLAGSISDEPLPALKGLPLPRRGSSIDAIDLKLLTTATRPRIKEKVRLTVREQARQLVATANAARPAPPVTKQKQSTPASKSSKVSNSIGKNLEDKKTNSRSDGPREPKREQPPPAPPRDVEEIFKELVEQGIAVKCPETNFSDFIGTCCLVCGNASGDTQPTPVKKAKSGGKAAHLAAKTSEPLVLYPEMSFAQIRQLLTAKCVLPLAIHDFKSDQNLKFTTPNGTCPITALIYGPRGSGKTMLVQAITHESKASIFDLSPKTLVKKYPGQQSIDAAVQSVFAAAKAAAPSIIYIDNIEQIFIRDEKRVAQLAEEIGGEPASRIRRQMLAEVAALKPEDGVLVLCTSREPHACVSADEASFISFFQFLVNIPLPDDRCRREILETFSIELKSSDFWTAQQLSLAAQLTQGYTAGALKAIMSHSFDTFQASKEKNVDILDCFIHATADEIKPNVTELQTTAEWTARAHAMLGKTLPTPPLK